ncbi:MAG: hypothetical protein ACRCYQ_02005 [Nocardioides sp.]
MVPAEFVVCGLCWRRLPEPLRRELSRSWHGWRRDLADLDLFGGYLAARGSVLGFLAGRRAAR